MNAKLEESDGMVVALDLGGSWIKGTVGRKESLLPTSTSFESRRWPNPLREIPIAGAYADLIDSRCREAAGGMKFARVAISTAGEVSASGRSYRTVASHLATMALPGWMEMLEDHLGCQVSLINDAEAFLMGSSRQRPG